MHPNQAHYTTKDPNNPNYGVPPSAYELRQLILDNNFLQQQNNLLKQMLRNSNQNQSNIFLESVESADNLQNNHNKGHPNPENAKKDGERPVYGDPKFQNKGDNSSTGANPVESNVEGISLFDKLMKAKEIVTSGETTEMGEKYYGPQSSRFMIEDLKADEEKTRRSSNKSSKRHHDDIYLPTNNPAFLEITSKGSNRLQETEQNQVSDSDNTGKRTGTPQGLVAQSLTKKKLPSISFNLIRFKDIKSLKTTQSHAELTKHNFGAIVQLVNKFFDSNSFYETFITRSDMLDFLNEYGSMGDQNWENDDDLLLLVIILALSFQKITPQEFADLNLLPASIKINPNRFKEVICEKVLMQHFDTLRHNLINESIRTVQAYILCLEWYFIRQRYEECWSLAFHTLSIAYAIGIHIQGRYRKIPSEDKRTTSPFSNAEAEEDSIGTDVERYKVWFALKSITSHLCSTMGRPNPISIHANFLVLQSNIESRSEASFKLKRAESHALLKVGLSELLRLSNIVAMKTYMDDFPFKELAALNIDYENEIKNLQWLCDHNVLQTNQRSIDEHTKLPVSVDRTNVLMDLIVLYVNRAKLFEPFVHDSNHNDEQEYDLILKSLISSLLKFTELFYTFLEEFMYKLLEKYKAKNINEVYAFSTIRFGRYFRSYYPFLNSTIYQGIVVIFAFIHYRLKDIIKRKGSHSFDNGVLKALEFNLNRLIDFDKIVSKKSDFDAKVWNNKTGNLIKRILDDVELIRAYESKFKVLDSDHKSKRFKHTDNVGSNHSQPEKGTPSNDEQNSQKIHSEFGDNFNPYSLYEVQFQDHFWRASPENLPYYSSPSDGDVDEGYLQSLIESNPILNRITSNNAQNQQRYHDQIPPSSNWNTYGNVDKYLDQQQGVYGMGSESQQGPLPYDIRTSMQHLKLDPVQESTDSLPTTGLSQSTLSLVQNAYSNTVTPSHPDLLGTEQRSQKTKTQYLDLQGQGQQLERPGPYGSQQKQLPPHHHHHSQVQQPQQAQLEPQSQIYDRQQTLIPAQPFNPCQPHPYRPFQGPRFAPYQGVPYHGANLTQIPYPYQQPPIQYSQQQQNAFSPSPNQYYPSQPPNQPPNQQ